MDPLELRLKAQARALGFSVAGVAPAEPSRHADFYRAWLERGAHGEMGYLAREDAVARRMDLARTLPNARSVIVVAHEYYADDTRGAGSPEAAGPDSQREARTDAASDPSRAVIARYARGRDYHKVVKKKLLRLLDWLRAEVGTEPGEPAREVQGRAYVDTGPLLERELATRAGLGWFGKNTMLIHPRRGSWFFLGCLLVDVELGADEPFAQDHCGSCSRCVEACPTGALKGRDVNGAPVIDARLCISYLTIESRGPIPRELRAAIGNRIYGCDICQEVCPWNGEKFVQLTSERAYRAHPDRESPPLVDLMQMDDAAWDAFSLGSAMRRAGRAGFLRNVAVALGNWGAAEAVPALAHALSDSSPLVRGHAAWALGRVGTESARASLGLRAELEEDPWVREEIALAVSG
jgi:epoxyqueuosine reductase